MSNTRKKLNLKLNLPLPPVTVTPAEVVPAAFTENGNLPIWKFKMQDHLEFRDMAALSQTCKAAHFFYKQSLRDRQFSKFIEYVVAKDFVKAAKLLAIAPDFFITKTNFKDDADRSFTDTSIFEYLYWNNNSTGWQSLLENLDEKVKVFDLAIAITTQLNELEIKGVTYQRDGKHYTEKQSDKPGSDHYFQTQIGRQELKAQLREYQMIMGKWIERTAPSSSSPKKAGCVIC